MIVRSVNDIKGTEREVEAENGNWLSRRLLLRKDGLGFSLNETIIRAGTQTHIEYKNHLEAVYCVDGEGEVELTDGRTYNIEAGVMYCLDRHDEHILRASRDMRLICVFNPPLNGKEVHDNDGSYPLE